jgi:hypothetical protein
MVDSAMNNSRSAENRSFNSTASTLLGSGASKGQKALRWKAYKKCSSFDPDNDQQSVFLRAVR